MDYKKPEFKIASVSAHGQVVKIVEYPVLEKPFCRLLCFERHSDDPAVIKKLQADPVVLVVAPLSGHFSTLLRDTVRTLLQDHKVYITDWTDAKMVPVTTGEFSLTDYVRYVQDFIRQLGAADLHLLSVCQPTVPVLAAVSLMASNKERTPRSMTMMGGPIDTRKNPTAVNEFATSHSYAWFERTRIQTVPSNYPGAGRRVYPGYLQHAGFVMMNFERHAKSHWEYFQNLIKGNTDGIDSHRAFYNEYNAVLDMDAAFYLETVKTVFQDFSLPLGTWKVDDCLVRPQDIRDTALFTVEGSLDDIVGAGQTKAAHDLCSNIPSDKHKHYEVSGAGHYGIFSGTSWRKLVYPQIVAFIRQQ